MSRRDVALMLLLAALSLGPGCAGPGPDEPSSELARLRKQLPRSPGCNVIVVSFDALRQDALGVYGYPRETSPNIDRFARRSLVFDEAYTAGSVTPTSFAAAFSGRLPTRSFVAWKLVADTSLAAHFREAGYRTAAFVNNVQLTPDRGFDQGFEHYDHHVSAPDEVILESALEWIAAHKTESSFIWIHFLSPHSPYDYRELASHLYDAEYRGRFSGGSGTTFETDDPREIARLRSLYDGEVFYADSLFGRLIQAFERLGVLERSVVVVTSDHGEEFKEHGSFKHTPVWEELVKIPMVVYHPDVRVGARSRVLVSNLDFLPTLSGIAGIDTGATTDGRDLTQLDHEPDTVLMVSMTAKKRWVGIRKGSHKLVVACEPDENAMTLYDLDSPAGDTRDILGELQPLGSELRERLDLALGGSPCDVVARAVAGVSIEEGLDEQAHEALRTLGYLN